LKSSSRLTRSEDIKCVRTEGKSFAHPSVVLVSLPNQIEHNRFAVIAGRSVGGAVQRNLAKRRIRSVIQDLANDLAQGYDIVIIARRSILENEYRSLEEALRQLFGRSGLMKDKVS
jgi:ribonuclease P protein component